MIAGPALGIEDVPGEDAPVVPGLVGENPEPDLARHEDHSPEHPAEAPHPVRVAARRMVDEPRHREREGRAAVQDDVGQAHPACHLHVGVDGVPDPGALAVDVGEVRGHRHRDFDKRRRPAVRTRGGGPWGRLRVHPVSALDRDPPVHARLVRRAHGIAVGIGRVEPGHDVGAGAPFLGEHGRRPGVEAISGSHEPVDVAVVGGVHALEPLIRGEPVRGEQVAPLEVHVPLRRDGEEGMGDDVAGRVEVVRRGVPEGRAEGHGPAGVHLVAMDAGARADECRVDGHASSLLAVARSGIRSGG